LLAQQVTTLVDAPCGDDIQWGSDGHLYSTDYGNTIIRKIALDGTIDTILTNHAKLGAIEVDDSLNIYACSYDFGYLIRFREGETPQRLLNNLAGPAGLMLDKDGYLLINENAANRIRMLNQGFFHSGNPLQWNTGITRDPAGNIYSANMFNGEIIKFTPEGEWTKLAQLPITSPSNFNLGYMTFANATLYLCHVELNRIYAINPETGIFSVLAGTGQAGYTNGTLQQAQFYHPTGITHSPSGDTLFVTDGPAGSQRLRMIELGTVTSVRNTVPAAIRIIQPPANPVTDLLELRYELMQSDTVLANLYDLTGRVWKGERSEKSKGVHQLQWNIEDLPASMYFLHVNVGRSEWMTVILKP